MLLARFLVGGYFAYLAIGKISDPIKFLKDIREYHLLPESMPFLFNFTAVSLPWIEILCGILLILGVWLRASAAVILVLMTFFTTAIFIRALGVYGGSDTAFCAIEFDCGCGSGVINICLKLITNLGLAALTAVVLLSRSRRFSLESLFGRRAVA
jgi:uncharacterized membrane protein YphA (DoxX/SURF4 family)